MNNERIRIFGDKENVAEIESIITALREKFPCKGEDLAVFAGDYDEFAPDESYSADIWVVHRDDKEKVSSKGKVLTYCQKIGDCDVTALGPQRTGVTASFEILTAGFMGRAFLKNGSEYTFRQVLVAFCALLAEGFKADEILREINEFTTKRTDEK